MNTERLICDRALAVDASGIRRIFNLAAKLEDPINLSIGQPDFKVPVSIKQGAIDAIDQDKNGYTLTKGIAPLLDKVNAHLKFDLGWDVAGNDAIDSFMGGNICRCGTYTRIRAAIVAAAQEVNR